MLFNIQSKSGRPTEHRPEPTKHWINRNFGLICLFTYIYQERTVFLMEAVSNEMEDALEERLLAKLSKRKESLSDNIR